MRAAVRNLLALCGMLAACVTPAYADKATEKEQIEARKFGASFARCVVKKRASTARMIVLQNAGPELLKRHMSAIFDPDCLSITGRNGAGLKFPNDTILYLLADALIKVDYAAAATFDFTSAPALEHRLSGVNNPASGTNLREEAQAGTQVRQTVASFMSTWGECVARRNPAGTHSLLLTTPDSPEEQAVIQTLSQAFGDCLTNGQLSLSREAVRGSLAVNFYRLAGAPAGASVKALKAS